MYQSTQSTEPVEQEVLYACALDALLLTDLATDGGPAPDVQEWDELGEGIHQAALTELLCVLAKGVAWHEVSDDAWKKKKKFRGK